MKKIILIFSLSLLLIPFLLVLPTETGATSKPWKEIDLLNYWGRLFNMSSELNGGDPGKFGKYDIGHIIDKDISTAWVEGVKGDGIGEYILIATPEETRTINIFTGYGKNLSLFTKNNRPKKLKLSYFLGIEAAFPSQYYSYYKARKFENDITITLKDTFAVQNIDFPFRNKKKLIAFKKKCLGDFKPTEYRKDMPAPPNPPGVKWILKIEITDVYKGSKWQDTCISEIFFNDRYIGNSHNYKNRKIEKVYESKDNDKIIMVTDSGNTLILCQSDNKYSVLYISEISKDNQWLTVLKETCEPKAPRAETEYLIFNTFLGKEMKPELEKVIGKEISGPCFLKYKYDLPSYQDDELYLEFEYSDGSGSGKIELR